MADERYCYPGTNVLKNKLNLQTIEALQKAEMEYTLARLFQLLEKPIEGNFDFNHLKKIHGFIFQDLYEWAGKTREIDIGKGNSLFCRVVNLNNFAEDIFSKYYKACYSVKNDRDVFIHTLANYYADLNALHPFREGNGRTQREFARELCMRCGYVFDLSNTKHSQMLNASIKAMTENSNDLEEIFKQAIIPESQYIDKGIERLGILSLDDLDIQDIVDDYEYYEVYED